MICCLASRVHSVNQGYWHGIQLKQHERGMNMLTDYQRKVLRILYNYKSGRRRFPTIQELTVKTGKYKSDVIAAMNALVSANYIQWDDKSDTVNIVILEGWEREDEKPNFPKAPLTVNPSNTDY